MRIHLPPTLVEPHSLLQIHPRCRGYHLDLLFNPTSVVYLSPPLLHQDHALFHPQSSQILRHQTDQESIHYRIIRVILGG